MDKISESEHSKDVYRHKHRQQDDHSENIIDDTAIAIAKTNVNVNVNVNVKTNKTEVVQEQGHIVLLGYGDVGKPVAHILMKNNASFVIVDKYEHAGEAPDVSDEFNFVVGDCVEEDVLISAGIKSATTVIVVLNNDTNVIYSTLVSRTLNPDAIILARANSSKSIDKIYKAGADYVASLPIIAGQMIAKLTRSCTDLVCDMYDHETTMLYEGIEIEKYRINQHSRTVDKTIKELDLRAKYGCTIIGVEVDGYVNVDIKPDFVLREGMIVALIGSKKQVHEFKADYEAAP